MLTAYNPSLGLVLGVAETGKTDVETGQESIDGLGQQWPGSETEKPGAPVLDQCLGHRTSNVPVQGDFCLRAQECLLG